MDKKLAILRYFFEDPSTAFHIREIAKLTRFNHMTARTYLNKLHQEGLLLKKELKLYMAYSANINRQFLNFKLYYNLEQLRIAELIEDLQEFYDYPVIVLFGSYSTATNTKDSDIDLFVITNIRKEFNLNRCEQILKRKISLQKVSEKEFKSMKTKNPELVNNICNGITLSGKIEVV